MTSSGARDGDLLLAFYGDDFTGSTDTMEALALAGVRTLLFLDPPTQGDLDAFGSVRAVGVAGSSRAMRPAEMDEALPGVFRDLAALGAPILRYKVCSTFDSSPAVGNIGRAIDIGARVTSSNCVPLVVGAPPLGRYCAFGNLFARSGLDTEPFRLDRHPTMSRHPVTPMDESDLRLHLANQTQRPIRLVDVLDLALSSDALDRRYASLAEDGDGVVLFDALTMDHLRAAGRVVWQEALRDPPLFVAGSSGADYALTEHWRVEGLCASREGLTCGPSAPVVVMSGSCSPVTDRQIDFAVSHGFREVALDTEALATPAARAASEELAAIEIRAAVAAGRHVVAHTARGPDDPRVPRTRELVGDAAGAARALGAAMGRILSDVLTAGLVNRVAVTGGDTSYHVARALGIRALETLAPVQPGSPLCRVYADTPEVDGVEMLFKGGQVGRDDLLVHTTRGTPV
jgi:3-oxoisoapionate kinase